MRISFQCLRAFCFVLFPALLLAVSANAQIDSSAKPTDDVSLNGIRGKKKAKGTGDRLVFSLNYSGLTALPAGISNQSLNRGFSYHSFSQKRFGIFAVAIGFGLSNANYYNTLTSYKPDAAQKFTAYVDSDGVDKSKLELTTLDVPVELRLNIPAGTRRRVRIAAGFSVGYVISSHRKLDYSKGYTVKYRHTDELKNIERFRYGITGRIGYGAFALTGYYGLNNLLKKDNDGGVNMMPFSIGIAFTNFDKLGGTK